MLLCKTQVGGNKLVSPMHIVHWTIRIISRKILVMWRNRLNGVGNTHFSQIKIQPTCSLQLLCKQKCRFPPANFSVAMLRHHSFVVAAKRPLKRCTTNLVGYQKISVWRANHMKPFKILRVAVTHTFHYCYEWVVNVNYENCEQIRRADPGYLH